LIASALDSVERQSVRAREIIVVDNGSTDETKEVVRRWRDERGMEAPDTRLVDQPIPGANAARNMGIQQAAGRYIAFLDSDDRWLPDKLAMQIAVMEQDEALGGVYCGLCTVDLDSEMGTPQPPRSFAAGRILADMLIHDVSNPTSCWMIRRECFDVVDLFDVALPARQDWDMWIRLTAKYPVGAVPDALVEMGEHPGERVRSDPSREIEAHRIIFDKYADLRAQFPPRVRLAARSAMYRRRGRVNLHRRGHRLRAAGLQLLAILVWPFNFDSYAALLGALLPAGLRRRLHVLWNSLFGKTSLAIKSH
jgi:glycosyltransferase involved in cell wall biosynthesis